MCALPPAAGVVYEATFDDGSTRELTGCQYNGHKLFAEGALGGAEAVCGFNEAALGLWRAGAWQGRAGMGLRLEAAAGRR